MNHLVLDVFDDLDVEKTFVKVASKLPADVRNLELMPSDVRDSLPDSAFALSVVTKTAHKLNKFPIHDRLNTALSNQYFDMNHGALPTDAQKIAASHIKTACLKQGLSPSKAVTLLGDTPTISNKYIEKLGSIPGGRAYMPSLRMGVYALEKKAGANISRRYPITTPDLLAKAVDYFEKYAREFSPEDRRQFSYNVKVQADLLGIPLKGRTIEKYAGVGYGNEIDTHINIRKRLEPKIASALDKLAAIRHEITPDEFAQALTRVDQTGGYENQYDNFIADPYAATFAKKGSQYMYEDEGITLDDTKLAEVFDKKHQTISGHFGSTLADALKKEGFPIFESLPKDVKQVIAKIAIGEIS